MTDVPVNYPVRMGARKLPLATGGCGSITQKSRRGAALNDN
jgi:hypothetical protein